MPTLTRENLRNVLRYDEGTGAFTWLKSGKGRRLDLAAGSVDRQGYVVIHIDYQRYRAHRLAWFYMTGEWPEQEIDHRDLNKENNRWENLRPATHSQNAANRPAHADNFSGIKGVSWSKPNRKWQARIVRDGNRTNLGYYENIEAAADAYRLAAAKTFGEFARAA